MSGTAPAARRSRPALLDIALFVLLAGALAWICNMVWLQLSPRWNWSRLEENKTLLLIGWRTTIEVAVAATLGSLLVGALFLAGQRSAFKPLRLLCAVILETVRCSPLLVLLLIGYFLIGAKLFARDIENAGYNEKFWLGAALLSLFGGAYTGEIFRGAVDSIPATQWDAARAAGFRRRQIYRYVIFPQALRRMLPALAGQFVSLIKDSSLLSVIGVTEFTYRTQGYLSKTYGLEAYLPLALGYLVLTVPIALLARWLEARMRFRT